MTTMQINLFTTLVISSITLTIGFQLGQFFARHSTDTSLSTASYMQSTTPIDDSLTQPLTLEGQIVNDKKSSALITENIEGKIVEESAVSTNKRFLQQILQQEKNTVNTMQLRFLLAQWAQIDLSAALEFAFRHQPETLVKIAIAIAGEQKNKQVLKWLSEHNAHRYYNAWLSIYFQNFDHLYANETLDYAQHFLEGKTKNDVINEVVSNWVNEDVVSTLNWLQNNIDGTENPQPYVIAINHYIEQSPWEAANFIATLPFELNPLRLTSRLAERLSQTDIYKAIDWAEKLPPEQTTKAIAQIMSNWSASNTPEIALNYLLDRTDIQANPEIFQTTIANIANKNPELLMARLIEFSDSAKIDVISHVAAHIAQKNEAYEYENWLNSLPIGGMRAAASLAGVEANMYSNPATAFKLAENLINPDQRLYYLTETAKFWSGIDINQVKLAIESTATLTTDQKSALLAELPL